MYCSVADASVGTELGCSGLPEGSEKMWQSGEVMLGQRLERMVDVTRQARRGKTSLGAWHIWGECSGRLTEACVQLKEF